MQVFVLTGYHPDFDFLRQLGVKLDPKPISPRSIRDTLESNVPGIYLAGVVIGGNHTSEIFIENGRFHGKQIIAALTGAPLAARAAGLSTRAPACQMRNDCEEEPRGRSARSYPWERVSRLARNFDFGWRGSPRFFQSMLLQQGQPGWRNFHHAAALRFVRGYESAVGGIFPNRDFGARRAPCIHHFFIAAIGLHEPVEKVHDQAFRDGVAHDGSPPFPSNRTARAGKDGCDSGNDFACGRWRCCDDVDVDDDDDGNDKIGTRVIGFGRRPESAVALAPRRVLIYRNFKTERLAAVHPSPTLRVEEATMETTELRPLSLGELLDRAFSLYRRNFWLFVGIMAIPSVFSVPFNLAFLSARNNRVGLPSPGTIAASVLAVAIFLCLYWVLYAIAIGATTFAVSETYLGRQATVRGSYGRVWRKFWGIIGVISRVTLRMMGVAILGTMALGVVAAISVAASLPLRSAGRAAGIAVAVVFGLAYLGFFAFIVFWSLRYAVSISALLLENIGVREAIDRSVELTEGRRPQIFVAVLLSIMIGYAGVIVFQGPFLVARLTAGPAAYQPAWIGFFSSAMGAVGGAITMPLLMIVLVLCYYDTRIRKEAFDLQFMMAALDGPVAAERPQGSVSPA